MTNENSASSENMKNSEEKSELDKDKLLEMLRDQREQLRMKDPEVFRIDLSRMVESISQAIHVALENQNSMAEEQGILRNNQKSIAQSLNDIITLLESGGRNKERETTEAA